MVFVLLYYGMHETVGPVYCETPFHAEVGFPIEPVNVWTSAIPLMLGVLAAYWLWKRGSRDWPAYTLAVLTACTGLGSMLWHGLRTELMLTLDVFPGLLAFLLMVFLWPSRLGNRWWAYVLIVSLFGTIFGLSYLLPTINSNGPPITVFLSVAIFAFILLGLTYQRKRYACGWAAVVVFAALAAAVSRTLDLSTCDWLPFGTHFLWHIFLGISSYAGVRLVTALKTNRNG